MINYLPANLTTRSVLTLCLWIKTFCAESIDIQQLMTQEIFGKLLYTTSAELSYYVICNCQFVQLI